MQIISCVASQINDLAIIKITFFKVRLLACRERILSLTKQKKKNYKLSFIFLTFFASSSLFAQLYPNGTLYQSGGNYYSLSIQSGGSDYGSCAHVTGILGSLPLYEIHYSNGYNCLTITYCASTSSVLWDSYIVGGSSSTSCPSGTKLDSHNVCSVPTCTPPLILNPTTLTCDIPSCQAGYIWDTTSLSCKNSCSSSQHWDSTHNMCVSNCTAPNISYSDGTCRLPCPAQTTFNQTDQKCYYDCSHFPIMEGGSITSCESHKDANGNQCHMGLSLMHPSKNCMTQSQVDSSLDFPLFGAGSASASKALKQIIGGLPNSDPAPVPEPQPLPKPLPANDPNFVPIPKPANDPNYVPEVVPNDPTPIPDIIPSPFKPSTDPVPAPSPSSVPDIAPLPAPDSAPAPDPAPLPAPSPAPASDPVPLPAPEPAPVVNPAPAPAPLPDVAPAPYAPPAVDPSLTPAPGTINPDPSFVPDPSSPPASSPDINVSYTMPNVPDFTDFSLDNLEHLKYDFTALSNNINGQVSNIDLAFRDTFTIINQGFQPLSIPSGTCGNSMAFDFVGHHVDLCPTLISVSSRFAPMISLFVFFLGFFIAIKVFIYGLKD